MNNHIGNRNEIGLMYGSDEGARAFFDWAAARTNDAAETSVERIAGVTGVSYSEARELAKQLCELGYGEFIIGRKGWKSRIRWDVSLRSLGRAAKDKDIEIEEVDPLLKEEAGEQVEPTTSAESAVSKGLTIAEAKRRLAEALGVAPEAIEITIKA